MNVPDSNSIDDLAKQATMSEAETSGLIRPWQDPSLFNEHEVQSTYISGGFLGIACAGCVYPFLMGGIVLLFSLFNSFSIDELFFALIALAIYSLIGGAIGLIVATVCGLFSIALTILMNRSLGYPLDARSAAISAGSLAGYAPTAWILFSPEFGGDFFEKAAIGFLGPVLAMTLGAVGAAWGSANFGGFDFAVATRRKKNKAIDHEHDDGDGLDCSHFRDRELFRWPWLCSCCCGLVCITGIHADDH